MLYLWIALGSALGGMTRAWAATFIAARYGAAFPLGTVLVNITGCFLIGLFAGLTGVGGRLPASPTFRVFFMVGVCGGYTTFSSFSLQTLELAQKGEWLPATVNVLGSVLGCLLAVWLGSGTAVLLNARR